MKVSVWDPAVTIDWCQDPAGKQAGQAQTRQTSQEEQVPLRGL